MSYWNLLPNEIKKEILDFRYFQDKIEHKKKFLETRIYILLLNLKCYGDERGAIKNINKLLENKITPSFMNLGTVKKIVYLDIAKLICEPDKASEHIKYKEPFNWHFD
jgi:hypothetical protein